MRSCTAIRNVVALVLAVSYFASVYIGQNIRLTMLVERVFLISKRFFGVPSFFNYVCYCRWNLQPPLFGQDRIAWLETKDYR